MTTGPDDFAYFLDVDGTLIDLADEPHHVKLSRTLPGLLDALYDRAGGAVALISGRSLADLDRLFPSLRLPAAGQHGLELRTATGRVFSHGARSHTLDPARALLTDFAARHRALLVEDKGLSIALHYRRAPRLAGVAHRTIRALQAQLGDRYVVHRGKRVVELAPAGRNKGAAIRALMREAPFRGLTPLFIGDDVTDEFGFAMVNRLGGTTIKVGPGPTVAGFRLPNVDAVLKWLRAGRPVPKRLRPEGEDGADEVWPRVSA